MRRLLLSLVCLCGSAYGAVAFDVASGGSSGSSTFTWTHTATGSHITAIVGVFAVSGSIPVPTYGGVTMTLAGSHTVSGAELIGLFYLTNAPAGASTVSVPATVYSEAVSATYTGTNGTIDASSTASGVSTTNDASISITSVAANTWMVAYFGDSGTGFAAVGTYPRRAVSTASASDLFDSNAALSAGSNSTAGNIIHGANSSWGAVAVTLAPYSAPATSVKHKVIN